MRPNKHEAGRANIVYNFEQRSTVSVDISGVLKVGHWHAAVTDVWDHAPAPTDPAYTPAPVTGPTFNVEKAP